MDEFPRLCLCLVGIIFSVYAYHVETSKAIDDDYEAMCDISSTISCSAIFTSEYGSGFGIITPIFGEDHFLNQPNSIFGFAFYLLQMSGIFWKDHLISMILFWTSAGGIIMCLYLAYILAFILHDFCVVCVTTYVVTFLLFCLNYRARNRIKCIAKKVD